MSRKRSRQKGRSGGTHLGIGHHIVRSAEFGCIPPWPLKLLIELAGTYNGFNNGNLSAAFSTLRSRGWNSPGTLSDALKWLQAHGWIVRTRAGNKNRCALYAVTWWPIDECQGKWLEIAPESGPRNTWKTQSVVATCSNVVATCSSQDLEAA
jgi:hypothetical protein